MSAWELLSIDSNFLKIHPTLPVKYMFKLLFRMSTFISCIKIMMILDILENSQKFWAKSQAEAKQPSCL